MIENLFLFLTLFSIVLALDCMYRATGGALSTCDCGVFIGNAVFEPACANIMAWHYNPILRGLCCQNISSGLGPFCCESVTLSSVTKSAAATTATATITKSAAATTTTATIAKSVATTTAAASSTADIMTPSTTKSLLQSFVPLQSPSSLTFATLTTTTTIESSVAQTKTEYAEIFTLSRVVNVFTFLTKSFALSRPDTEKKQDTTSTLEATLLQTKLVREVSKSAVLSSETRQSSTLVALSIAIPGIVIIIGCIVSAVFLVLRRRRKSQIDVENNTAKIEDVKPVSESDATSSNNIDNNTTMSLSAKDGIVARLPYATFPAANFSSPLGYVFFPRAEPNHPTQHAYLNSPQLLVATSHYANPNQIPCNQFDYDRASAGFVKDIRDLEQEYEQHKKESKK